ncbi:MAG: restriction endonuclease [Bacteroidia bacterium]|nr:restriction endonuclease [Bacteroidia bacterium]
MILEHYQSMVAIICNHPFIVLVIIILFVWYISKTITSLKRTISFLEERESDMCNRHFNEMREKKEEITSIQYDHRRELWENNNAHRKDMEALRNSLYPKEQELKEGIRENNRKKAQLVQLLDAVDKRQLLSMSASLKADVESMIYDDMSDYLRFKDRPAYTAAETVDELKKQTRQHIAEYKEMLYRYELLMSQFPELKEYVDSAEDVKTIMEETSLGDLANQYDNSRNWLSDEEYNNLSEVERNQRALDNWMNRNKTNREIGFEYEMYIGYLYRIGGWNVEQFGIERGLEDMGRDIIAWKVEDGIKTVHIIQCKRWSTSKTIHENVICQLYGTAVQYKLKHNEPIRVKAVFVATTDLSDTAKAFANELGVIVRVKAMGDFPRIKCNINKATHQKIYHLPFDQQYYTVHIDQDGEFYASTVQEAVNKGFRRAFRHRN